MLPLPPVIPTPPRLQDSTDWIGVLEAVGWPTTVIVLDWECFFSADYHLRGKGAKGLSTIEYITDRRYESLGVACLTATPEKRGPAEFWHNDEEQIAWLQKRYGENLERCTVVIQNARFDGTILARRHDIVLPYIVDTLALSKHQDARNRHGLGELCKRWNLPDKGDTMQFKGLRWADMNSGQKQALADYACNDAEREMDLFAILLPLLTRPEVELPLIRHTLRLFWEPELRFDFAEGERLQALMTAQVDKETESLGLTPKQISGNKTFVAELALALAEAGEEVPMKYGKRGLIAALATTDQAVEDLKRHKLPRVRALIRARQAVKSWPLHVKRLRAMASQAKAAGGMLPNPLNYYGAHTGRWSGGEGINLCNLPTRGGGLACEIKHCLVAPEGKVLILADAAQIEARGLAWIAGQTDLIEDFALGRDLYSIFAAEVLRAPCRKPRKDDPGPVARLYSGRRALGKVGILGCFEAGTPVLTRRGWVSIEQVTPKDSVWDGEQWTTTIGPIFQGLKTTIRWQGIGVTPDHQILTREGWASVSQVLRGGTHSLRSAQSMGTLKSLGTHSVLAAELERLKLCVRNAVAQSTGWMFTISSVEKVLAAISVLSSRVVAGERSGADTRRLSPMGTYAADCLIESRLFTCDAGIRKIRTGPTMGAGASVSPPSGWGTGPQCCGILSLFQDTLTRLWKSTVSTIVGGTNRATSVSAPGRGTWRIAEQSDNSRGRMPTYDLGLCGSNNRFTILTTAGPMVVHNCGYGMGGLRCHEYMETFPELRSKVESGEIDLAFSKRLVDAYRNKYRMVPKFWKDIENAFRFTVRYGKPSVCRGIAVSKEGTRIVLSLPSGRSLFYPFAAVASDGRISFRWGDLWGGTLTENIVQAASRDLLAETILRVEGAGFRVAHHCYDSLVVVAKESDAERAKEVVCEAFTHCPLWATGWPLGVEASIGVKYE